MVIEKICLTCGKTFKVKSYRKNRKYCSLPCFYASGKLRNTGRTHFKKGYVPSRDDLWTQEEVRILRENWVNMTVEELRKLLPKRSKNGILHKASRLGLRKVPMRIESVKKKVSKTLRRLYAEGKLSAWNKGLSKENDERVKKQADWMKGKNNPMKRLDVRMRNSEAHKGQHSSPRTEFRRGQHASPSTEFTSERLKRMWRDKNHRNKVIQKGLKARQKKPNKKESKLVEILKENNISFDYVGDGELVIDGLCPDFSDGNGSLIELFGDYWHRNDDPQERIDFFRERGYRCLVIWEHELEKPGLIDKIKAFMVD